MTRFRWHKVFRGENNLRFVTKSYKKILRLCDGVSKRACVHTHTNIELTVMFCSVVRSVYVWYVCSLRLNFDHLCAIIYFCFLHIISFLCECVSVEWCVCLCVLLIVLFVHLLLLHLSFLFQTSQQKYPTRPLFIYMSLSYFVCSCLCVCVFVYFLHVYMYIYNINIKNYKQFLILLLLLLFLC